LSPITFGTIVVAVVDNALTVKELDLRGPVPCLRAHHPDYPPLVPREGQELEVWGVVAGVVRKLP
jgi:DNA polymerase V